MTTAAIAKDDLEAWYEAQREINPDAEKLGLPKQPQTSDGPEKPDSISKIEAVAEALDVPECVVTEGGQRVTVASPSLDDLLNLFKALQAESGNLQDFAKKAEQMGDQATTADFGGLLKTAPAARTMFLRCIKVQRENGIDEPFASEDEKWKWYTTELGAVDAIDILDMFTERVDWAKLIDKVRRIMGKLQGLAVTVRQSKK